MSMQQQQPAARHAGITITGQQGNVVQAFTTALERVNVAIINTKQIGSNSRHDIALTCVILAPYSRIVLLYLLLRSKQHDSLHDERLN